MTLDETIKGLTEAARELGREVRAHRVAMEKERAGAAQPPASEVAEAMKALKDASGGAWDRPEGEAELAARASESMPACPKCGTNHCVIESVVRPEKGSHYCPARHEDSNIGHWFTPPPRDADAGATKPTSPDPLAAVRELCEAASNYFRTNWPIERYRGVHDELRVFFNAADALLPTLRLLPEG
ncbi:MAG: hypothetical protein KDA89_25525, partial [Planctomycetaceae bacterium]|nr:hypothetical protein [Planctomycetaceae bacterium]